jgi:thiamine-phosphate pyrophosphorylase
VRGARDLPDPPLLLITDRRQARLPLIAVVEQALAAGCRWVSFREKDLAAAEQIALAARLVPVAQRHGARLSLHGDVALARAAGLAAVHLPAAGDAAAARAALPAGLIGMSIHAPGEAAALDPTLVDYAVAGPAWLTASKPGYGPALGPQGIAAMAAAAPVPVIAVGGIEPALVGEVLTAGAAGIAVMGSVMRAAEPGREIAALLAELARQPRPR